MTRKTRSAHQHLSGQALRVLEPSLRVSTRHRDAWRKCSLCSWRSLPTRTAALSIFSSHAPPRLFQHSTLCGQEEERASLAARGGVIRRALRGLWQTPAESYAGLPERFLRLAASASNPRPMPSIHTSLLTAIPAGAGQTLPGLRRAGVRAYMVSSEPENPVRAAPATAFETKGARRSAPVRTSPAANTLRKRSGGIDLRKGKAPAAMA